MSTACAASAACAAPGAPPLLVACLCARWCRTCDEYAATFEALAAAFAAQAAFRWIDVEDDEALADAVEVENFPTLLIARGEAVAFFGPVTPQPPVSRALIERALRGELAAGGPAGAAELARRLGPPLPAPG